MHSLRRRLKFTVARLSGVALALLADNKSMSRSLLAATTLIVFATACVGDQSLNSFTTDGCSMFPDRSFIGSADWCGCCLKHDLAYWKGGTAKERLAADQQLKTCVKEVTGNGILASLMYGGVRVAGGPYYFTPYRWGYGWSFGRPYGPLSDDERQMAEKLEREYRASNPSLNCPK